MPDDQELAPIEIRVRGEIPPDQIPLILEGVYELSELLNLTVTDAHISGTPTEIAKFKRKHPDVTTEKLNSLGGFLAHFTIRSIIDIEGE